MLGALKILANCKLKLKRFGGLDLLHEALDVVRTHGMEPVLGDGVGVELGCWMEGCVARDTIRNAGEFNGFLKPKVRLFAEPLQFKAGELIFPQGFWPLIDRDVLAAHETARERFAPAIAASSGSNLSLEPLPVRTRFHGHVRFGSFADKPSRAKTNLCPLLLQ